MKEITTDSVLRALEQKLHKKPDWAVYDATQLQGGTVGNVVKLTGDAALEGETFPFTLVVKTQKQWDRHGDPDCWRREYDIYRQALPEQLLPFIRLPRCYLLEETQDVTRIFMEFIEGKTGNMQLHGEELALAAGRLGALQADFHLHGRKDLPCLRRFPAVRSSFDLWYGRMRPLLQKPIKGFPEELRQTLNRYAERAGEQFCLFDRLPRTVCQGDVHHDNLILREAAGETTVYLIDWDSAGYGYMGEDAVDVLMEAFVYSDRDVALLPLFREKILAGYCNGAKSAGVNFSMSPELFRSIAAYAWGFRIADLYLYYQDKPSKHRCVQILQTVLGEEPS